MKLTMLGVGNGFSPQVYDNNALLESGEERTLIDCGTTAWIALQELHIPRETIQSIFLTHLHFDHSGGVESAALYSKYITQTSMRLIVPAPIRERLWENTLKGTIYNKADNLVHLEDYFQVESPQEKEVFTLCGSVSAYWIQTKHIAGKFSCGLVLNNRIFYTSDMVNDLPLLEKLVADGIDTIFHDCQLSHAVVHADFQTLMEYPAHIREKMYLMHHGILHSADFPAANGMQFLQQHKTMEL